MACGRAAGLESRWANGSLPRDPQFPDDKRTIMSRSHRIEKDSLGEVRVPTDALYGAQTQRAAENFPISGRRFTRRFIEALGRLKEAAAETNAELGLVSEPLADAIRAAAHEVAEGVWDDHFVLDVYQTGSGTSTNMNANEVIAALANRAIAGAAHVHPNDHVNYGQSSNDISRRRSTYPVARRFETSWCQRLRGCVTHWARRRGTSTGSSSQGAPI